ncbi:hypothetical protein PIB30_026600 [Stylosanthes scabra]|uniref:Uncharacterized protein n=1 Tax=Stylosanthes scabra TaxID=79078 RepID=A0ABU6UDN6_9FABA|nr:hypothetical protein [Stylosanthes scabra]
MNRIMNLYKTSPVKTLHVTRIPAGNVSNKASWTGNFPRGDGDGAKILPRQWRRLEQGIPGTRPPKAELTVSLSPHHADAAASLAPPSSHRRSCAVSLASSLSPILEPKTEACRHRCLPLQNRFSPPSLSLTPDSELLEADNVSTPDLKLADVPSPPDTKLAVILLYSRHRSSSSPPEASRSSHYLCTSRI